MLRPTPIATRGSDVAEAEPAPFNVQTHFAWLRTRLSAERTLMSWDRTALSLIGFGFTIYQFFEKLQQATAGEGVRRPEAARNLGLALVIAGTLGTFAALWQYYAVVRYLEGDEFEAERQPEGASPLVITVRADNPSRGNRRHHHRMDAGARLKYENGSRIRLDTPESGNVRTATTEYSRHVGR